MQNSAKNLIEQASVCLAKNKISEPLENSEWLLCHILRKPRLFFRVYSEIKISAKNVAKFQKSINLKSKGFPLSYITKTHNFMGTDFKVNENVLIPRSETEYLVLKAIEYIKSRNKKLDILELCTGSGVISSVLATKFKNIKITASDICPKAISVAKQNAKKSKIKFTKSDLFENITAKFDIIIANPPYLSNLDMRNMQKELYFEPKTALCGGRQGFELIKKIIEQSPKYLKSKGMLFLEIGKKHKNKILKTINPKIWQNIKVEKDLNGFDRYLTAEKHNG